MRFRSSRSTFKTFARWDDRCCDHCHPDGLFLFAAKMKTQQEIWKAIAECNGEYHISNHGAVKSYKFGKERILKPYLIGVLGNQYFAIGICTNGKMKNQKIHKLIASAFIPNPLNKLTVNHKDGNKTNNHIDNLEWLTHKENIQHAWTTGLFESKRLAVSKARSKPVIDILTNKKYDSLIKACIDIGESYNVHLGRHHQSSKLKRFFYINDNGNG